MSPVAAAVLVFVGAYLTGAVPFGYLLGRVRGVDLFRAGSGNVGATNVGRVLGPGLGGLCFVLDFLKGAGPVWLAGPLAGALNPGTAAAVGGADALRVGAAALAFGGHLFPVWLGFRGGKGVATGAGTIAVLMPGPTAVAALAWAAVVLASRTVSLASVVAAGALVAARVGADPSPFGPGAGIVTGYCLLGAAVVLVRHRGNLGRLRAGTENRLGDRPMRHTLLKGLHLVAVGLWFGGAAFFNFGTAPAIFASFQQVVETAPSDRTAGKPLLPPGATDDDKKALAGALAGAAVGPVFPRYFGMQAVCGGVALATALAWWPAGRVHRWRVLVLAAAALTVGVAWPVSQHVGELRPARYADPSANTAFVQWHLVSLGLSFVTVGLAGVGLALGAKLPEGQTPRA